MTDTSETPNMQHTAGQTITVQRGKTRGKTAEIMGVDAPNQQYAVKYEDGSYGVVNAVNVKAPAEATIGERRLADEIQTVAGDHADEAGTQSALQALVSRLSSDLPGLGARIAWPVSE